MNDPKIVQDLQKCIADILDDETRKAKEHLGNPYWSSDGHNIGEDELDAIALARRVDFRLLDSDEGQARIYAERILRSLEVCKPTFRELAPDPEGYGIGTLHEITRRFAGACAQLQIKVTESA